VNGIILTLQCSVLVYGTHIGDACPLTN